MPRVFGTALATPLPRAESELHAGDRFCLSDGAGSRKCIGTRERSLPPAPDGRNATKGLQGRERPAARAMVTSNRRLCPGRAKTWAVRRSCHFAPCQALPCHDLGGASRGRAGSQGSAVTEHVKRGAEGATLTARPPAPQCRPVVAGEPRASQKGWPHQLGPLRMLPRPNRPHARSARSVRR